jgi:hypothetical protein
MTFHNSVISALVLTSMVVTAGAQEKPGAYDTPETVFKAAQAAIKRQDIKGYFGCLTEDSQKLMTGGLVMHGSMIKAGAARNPGDEMAELVKPIDEVFSKHGLTEEALKKIGPPKDAREAAKNIRAAADLVKSRVGFSSDMIAVLEKGRPKGADPFAAGKLADVKIEGDRARGTIEMKFGESEHKEPIQFVKVDGSWKLVLPEPKAAPPPPKLPPPAKDSKEQY